jgi:hypothetical protein
MQQGPDVVLAVWRRFGVVLLDWKSTNLAVSLFDPLGQLV